MNVDFNWGFVIRTFHFIEQHIQLKPHTCTIYANLINVFNVNESEFLELLSYFVPILVHYC